MKLKKEKGFTLIELLVVISLIGILATLVLANLNSARERARDAQRKSDLRNLKTALMLYYNDNGEFPATLPAWGDDFSDGDTIYMDVLPTDPLPGQAYLYDPDVDQQTYLLKACLENTSDANGETPSSNWCDTDWMYVVKP